ncbi:uncharacterized protein LOC129612926 [Condylostylus longicornis]|uniref:uncharacterized protein LOC129612926 n=1 Tax=Condylostylus longicornis TaxID=2530218 RepID=UPI00244E5443|nr:uncharacterized protein LOC129612926 [Condylostylus longicornis]
MHLIGTIFVFYGFSMLYFEIIGAYHLHTRKDLSVQEGKPLYLNYSFPIEYPEHIENKGYIDCNWVFPIEENKLVDIHDIPSISDNLTTLICDLEIPEVSGLHEGLYKCQFFYKRELIAEQSFYMTVEKTETSLKSTFNWWYVEGTLLAICLLLICYLLFLCCRRIYKNRNNADSTIKNNNVQQQIPLNTQNDCNETSVVNKTSSRNKTPEVKETAELIPSTPRESRKRRLSTI